MFYRGASGAFRHGSRTFPRTSLSGGGSACSDRWLAFAGRRWLHLHEYQSKALLSRFRCPVQAGREASTVDEVVAVATELRDGGARDLILKSQILAGGRGKGVLSSGLRGGVQICGTPAEAAALAARMLGFRLRTHQTGAGSGELVEKLLVLRGVDILREYYLALLLSAADGGPVIVSSREGGVDVERVAAERPATVVTTPIAHRRGPPAVTMAEAARVAESLDFEDVGQLHELLNRLYTLFVELDALTVEINPLAVVAEQPAAAGTSGENVGAASQKGVCEPAGPGEGNAAAGNAAAGNAAAGNAAAGHLSKTGEKGMHAKCGGSLMCVDAKLTFDDNAIVIRHSALSSLEDISRVDPLELRARASGLSYVPMDGTIGCLVNGAGLAMGTMDIIKLHGGAPANFLDVGGGATREQVAAAFDILTSDPKVRVILVNIFGGIMRCDIIAEGIVEALGAGAGGARRPTCTPAAASEGTTYPQSATLVQNTESSLSNNQPAPAKQPTIPIIIRLVGNREAEGTAIIRAAKIPECFILPDLTEAAQAACRKAGAAPPAR